MDLFLLRERKKKEREREREGICEVNQLESLSVCSNLTVLCRVCKGML